MKILVINAGSSSLKYQLLNPTSGELLAKGLCERIGIDGLFTYKPQLPGKEAIKAASVSMPTHSEAIQAVLNALVDEKNGVIGSMKEIDAVGHRVVHGGEKFAKSVVITDEVMQAIEECNPLAPLHNPANIIGIKACQELMPGVPMVAVFDTAFHQTMPPVAYTYALPYEYYEKDKVRRYGFHGTSHKYVSQRAADMLGKPIEQLKLISCHLGNGSSLSAVADGKCQDTSMGLSPLADAVMDAVQGGAARVFCIPVAASTAGTIGEVTKTGDGGGSVTVQGSPNNAYALTVRFTAQGGLNTAAFVYSIDGDNFSDERRERH